MQHLGAEHDRWFLWLPVAYGGGIALYFALDREPPLLTGGAAAVLCAILAVFCRRRPGPFVLAISLLMIALGMIVAQFRTDLVEAPILAAEYGPVPVSGRVVGIDARSDGIRATLDRLEIRGLSPVATPERIRIRLPRRAEMPPVGATITLRAVLNPPPAPVTPGSFDFGRQLFFEGIGAVGYGISDVRVDAASDRAVSARSVEAVRLAMAQRIADALPGQEGALAAALLTGERGGLSNEVLTDMRASGLAHLLAISGLHVSLVAAIVFAVTRTFAAAIEPLALRYPIKKWAAVAAMIAAFGYMILVGATVPTQRAFLMTAVVLSAVLFDRRALSMRSVALAALAVLTVAPESLLGPSFQMSFAAVVALIATYEALTLRRRGGVPKSGLLHASSRYVGATLLTSLVAGLATAPFAIHHFQQAVPFGLPANLLAVPVTAFWIMPWGVLTYAAMPFGLETIALIPMGWGIRFVLSVASAVAQIPGAILPVPPMSDAGLVCLVLGGLWLAIWKTRWRLWGVFGIAAGLVSILLLPRPHILISDDARLIGVRMADGALSLSSGRVGRFTAQIWVRRDGRLSSGRWPEHGVSEDGRLHCDGVGCIYRAEDVTVALIRDRSALFEDCGRVDIVISPMPARTCRAPTVIDRFDVWRNGGHAIYLEKGSASVETVRMDRGARPWNPAAVSRDAVASTASRPIKDPVDQ